MQTYARINESVAYLKQKVTPSVSVSLWTGHQATEEIAISIPTKKSSFDTNNKAKVKIAWQHDAGVPDADSRSPFQIVLRKPTI